MTERTLQIGTAEVEYEIEENELVLGVFLVIQTADIDDPGVTQTQICVPDTQDFVKSLGLARYGQLRTDARIGEANDE